MNRYFISAPLPRLDEGPKKEPWQAPAAPITSLDQLPAPYLNKFLSHLSDGILSARSGRALEVEARKAHIAKVVTDTLGKIMTVGLSKKEAVFLMSAAIKTWKISGASRGSVLVFEEFKQRIFDIENSIDMEEQHL